jgi:hypothetical protein
MRCEKPVDDGNYWNISSKRCGKEEQYYYSYVVVNYFYQRFCCEIHSKALQSRDEGKDQ